MPREGTSSTVKAFALSVSYKRKLITSCPSGLLSSRCTYRTYRMASRSLAGSGSTHGLLILVVGELHMCRGCLGEGTRSTLRHSPSLSHTKTHHILPLGPPPLPMQWTLSHSHILPLWAYSSPMQWALFPPRALAPFFLGSPARRSPDARPAPSGCADHHLIITPYIFSFIIGFGLLRWGLHSPGRGGGKLSAVRTPMTRDSAT